MRILKSMITMILLLTIFLNSSPHSQVNTIKSNAYAIKTNQIVGAPGMYFNGVATIEVINLFSKYSKLSEIVEVGAKLITNIETLVIYKDRIITNTVNIADKSFELFKNRAKRQHNTTFIVDGISLLLGIVGGILIPNTVQFVSYTGMILAGGGFITFSINHLIVLFKRFKKFRFI